MADEAFIWDQRQERTARPVASPARPSPPGDAPPGDAPPVEGRITLREAEHRFGVPVGTLRGWARKGTINGVMGRGPYGRQWLVTPESIAHHLSRRAEAQAPRPDSPKTGPTPDGSAMLVPRDAWDRLMDQLGNLHEAGLRLAEARERAAKAETEASFLRERLGELRAERDDLKDRLEVQPAKAAPNDPWASIRRAYRRLIGR